MIILRASIIFFVSALVFILAPQAIGQTCKINRIQFRPPDPKPGRQLSIYASLFPGEQKNREVTISLTTFTDLNNNGAYDQDERIRLTSVTKKVDNNDEVLVPIYEVPSERMPQRYLVIVSCGESRRSQSIEVESGQSMQAPCGEGTGRPCVPLQMAQRIRDANRRIIRRSTDKTYEGGRSIYTYGINEKSLVLIVKSSDALYLSPAWSPDSKRLAFIINQGGKKRIALTSLQDKRLQVITDGPNDSSPFWLPDGGNILFVRDKRLYKVDSQTLEARILDNNLQVDSIIGVVAGKPGTLQVFYEAPDPDAQETYSQFRLELDDQYKQRSVTQLFDDPRLYLSSLVSPGGGEVVYSRTITQTLSSGEKVLRDHLFIDSLSSQVSKELLDDTFNYYEASWSPDGRRIVFVSDRP